jgi:hypothetical protein
MEQTPSKPQAHVVKLTTGQGLLMLGGLVVLFGGFFFWAAMRSGTTVGGTVTGQNKSMEIFGCLVDRVSDELTLALRDNPPKQGFHEEKRAIILKDTSEKGETSKARPVEGLLVSYRDDNSVVTQLTCEIANNSLTIRSGRRSSQPGRRLEDQWNGTFEATCNSGATGELAIKTEMKNCD